MAKRATVLIHILNPARDYPGYFLVSKILEKDFGFQVVFCNDHNVYQSLRYYRPQAYVAPYLASPFTEKIAREALKYGKLFLYASERGFVDETQNINFFKAADPELRSKVSRIYLMGKNNLKPFIENDIYQEEQIRVCGKLDYDLFLFPDQKKKQTERKFDVGISLCGSFLNGKDVPSAMHKIFRVVDRTSGKRNKTYINWPFRYMEISSQYMSLLSTLRAVNELHFQNPELSFLARAHPREREETYFDFFKNFDSNKVVVNSQQYLLDYIRSCHCIIHEGSSSSLDAIIAGVPAISIRKLCPPEFQKYMREAGLYNQVDYVECQWMPESIEELSDLVAKAKVGELDLCPEEKKAELMNYLDNWFHTTSREKFACKVLAEDIAQQIGEEAQGDRSAVDQGGFKDYLKLIKSNLRTPDKNYLRLYQQNSTLKGFVENQLV
jgi:surface carbohydrate biosynthesis protein